MWFSIPRRELQVIAALVVAVVLPVYLLTANWSVLQTHDARSAALAGWTAASTGSLALNPDWPPEYTSWAATGRDGRLYSNRFPGVLAIATAAYLIPVAARWIPRSTTVDHPYELPIWPATAAAVVIATTAIFVTYVFLRGLGFPLVVATVSTAVVAFGSPVWSVSADALWTHGITHLSIVCGLIAFKKERAAAAGASFALATVTRPHLVVVPLVLACFRLGRRTRLGGVIGGLTGLGLSALYSWIVFGRAVPSGGYNVEGLVGLAPFRSLVGIATNLWDWISDPLHGIAVFVPLALIALAGVPMVWRSVDPLIRVAALAGLAYAATQLGLIRASGGVIVYGHRTTIETFVLCLPLFVASLWAIVRSSSAGRAVVGAVVAYSVGLHAYVAWIDLHPVVRGLLQEVHARAMSERGR